MLSASLRSAGSSPAHITGNLVILAAHNITDKFGQIEPLLSVPMFVGVLGLVTFAFTFCEMSIFERLRKGYEEKIDS
jgi:uncharacterized membrane protein YoaK (UPF0700 family)